MPYLPPPSFQWPSEADYARGMVGAVGAVLPSLDDLTTPIATQVKALRSAFEQRTGLKFGQLVTLATDIDALAHASTPAQIVTAAFDVMQGSLAIAGSVAQAAGVATSAVQAIPLIGQLIGTICAAFQFALGYQQVTAAKDQACEQSLARVMNDWERDVLRPHSAPTPTGEITPTNPNGVDPTDLFRALAYLRQDNGDRDREWSHDPSDWRYDFTSYHYDLAHMGAASAFMPWEGNNYPANASTLYLGLAGRYPRFAPPYSHVAPSDFALWPADDHQRTGGNHYGYGYLAWCDDTGTPPMSPETQRQIWQLCLALMLGVRDPTPGKKGISHPDGGQSLMPILQDIVNREMRAGRITPELLELVQMRALHWTWRRYGCGTRFFACGFCPAEVNKPGLSASFANGIRANVRDKASTTMMPPAALDLVGPFIAAIDQYDWQVRHAIADSFKGGRELVLRPHVLLDRMGKPQLRNPALLHFLSSAMSRQPSDSTAPRWRRLGRHGAPAVAALYSAGDIATDLGAALGGAFDLEEA